MVNLSAIWTPILHDQLLSKQQPRHCFKSAVAVDSVNEFLYLIGGRFCKRAKAECWRFDLAKGAWKKLIVEGLPLLEGHSACIIQDSLFVVGGSFARLTKNCASVAQISNTSKQIKFRLIRSNPGPMPSIGHSLIAVKKQLYLYGGYVDLQGSSDQFWILNSDVNRWMKAENFTVTHKNPGSRHNHSAVMFENYMYIFGGLKNHTELADFWRFDCVNKKWEEVKSRSPGPLHGHSACVAAKIMFVFGGSHGGTLSNELWCFYFERLTWSRIPFHSVALPNPVAFHCMTVAYDSLDWTPIESYPSEKESLFITDFEAVEESPISAVDKVEEKHKTRKTLKKIHQNHFKTSTCLSRKTGSCMNRSGYESSEEYLVRKSRKSSNSSIFVNRGFVGDRTTSIPNLIKFSDSLENRRCESIEMAEFPTIRYENWIQFSESNFASARPKSESEEIFMNSKSGKVELEKISFWEKLSSTIEEKSIVVGTVASTVADAVTSTAAHTVTGTVAGTVTNTVADTVTGTVICSFLVFGGKNEVEGCEASVPLRTWICKILKQ